MANDFWQVADYLPDIVRDIVDVIGMDATMRLVEALGGADFDVPVGRADGRCMKILQAVLKPEEIELFLSIFGGERIYIPRCEAALRELRNRRFIAAVDYLMCQGYSRKGAVQKLIADYGITERWAYEIMRTRDNPQQNLI